ncbi:MAG TPA: hypothetical protein VF185_00795 [Patescibacteria group bacterium]
MPEGQEGETDKIQTIVNSLKTDYAQSASTPEEQFKMNVKTGIQSLGIAEIWATGRRGTREDANKLVSEGLKKIKSLYKADPSQSQFVPLLEPTVDEIVKEIEERQQKAGKNGETPFTKLLKDNKKVLSE